MAPLPAERVQPSTPFAVTGLDFAGLLYTKKDQSAKSYILLLTCAMTRALHLELSSDMYVDKFLMALDRFVSRQGLPHTLYSDNAATFQAARQDMYHFEQPTDIPLLRTSRHHLEIHCSMGSLVGRMVGANGRHNQTLHNESLGKETSRRRETEHNSG